jgi:hypothetical protein
MAASNGSKRMARFLIVVSILAVCAIPAVNFVLSIREAADKVQ